MAVELAADFVSADAAPGVTAGSAGRPARAEPLARRFGMAELEAPAGAGLVSPDPKAPSGVRCRVGSPPTGTVIVAEYDAPGGTPQPAIPDKSATAITTHRRRPGRRRDRDEVLALDARGRRSPIFMCRLRGIPNASSFPFEVRVVCGYLSIQW